MRGAASDAPPGEQHMKTYSKIEGNQRICGPVKHTCCKTIVLSKSKAFNIIFREIFTEEPVKSFV